jgi:multiple sugar transport system permease protein
VRRVKHALWAVVKSLFVIFMLIFALAPIAWLVIGSLSGVDIQTFNQARNIPWSHLWDNRQVYRFFWDFPPFRDSLYASLILCGGGTVVTVVVAVLAGYSLARFSFRGNATFLFLTFAALMTPSALVLLPTYVSVGWLETHTGIVLRNNYFGGILLYSGITLPLAIILARGFFASLPRQLEDAALVDGCTPFGAFRKVVLPNAAPGVFAIAFISFLLLWSERNIGSYLFASNPHTTTMPVWLFNNISTYTGAGTPLAPAVIAAVPCVLLFIVGQRWLRRGLQAWVVDG